jgi:Mn-dependent DtxR family transcriptional regulator
MRRINKHESKDLPRSDDAFEGGMMMVLHESAEMYLETIYLLTLDQPHVRAIDIARTMGYSKPTISEWMHKLSDNGYVVVDANRNISLTDQGTDYAQKIYDRHTTLTHIFEAVGVNSETAHADACRVEHYISDETFQCLKKHFLSHHPDQGDSQSSAIPASK